MSNRTQIAFVVAGLAVAGLAMSVPASAGVNGTPSAKATARTGKINLVSGPTTAGQFEGAWTPILSNTLKMPNQKDLFMGVSLEVMLYTETTVLSKNATRDTSTASSAVQVRVLVDGRVAEPGVVVFGRRSQTLSAVMQGIISGALSVDPLTGAVVVDPTLVTPEEVSLILESSDAAHFDFVMDDLPAGTHKIEVQARVDLGEKAMAGSAVSRALVGKGCLTVEEVRLIKNEDIYLD